MSTPNYIVDLAGTARSEFRIKPAAAVGAPTSGYHLIGEVHVGSLGDVWSCVATGTPGTWKRVSVVDGYSAAVAAGTYVLDTVSVAQYYSVKWVIEFRNGSRVLLQEIAASHDDTVNVSDIRPVSMQIGTGTFDVSADVDLVSGSLRLVATALSSGWTISWRRVYTLGPPIVGSGS